MDRSRTIASSGSANYFFLSQVIRYEFERRIQQILRSFDIDAKNMSVAVFLSYFFVKNTS